LGDGAAGTKINIIWMGRYDQGALGLWGISWAGHRGPYE
jgi:hypothetical protein